MSHKWDKIDSGFEPRKHGFFVFVWFCFGSTGVWTWGLMFARQALHVLVETEEGVGMWLRPFPQPEHNGSRQDVDTARPRPSKGEWTPLYICGSFSSSIKKPGYGEPIIDTQTQQGHGEPEGHKMRQAWVPGLLHGWKLLSTHSTHCRCSMIKK
jgi:hypothetical protein